MSWSRLPRLPPPRLVRESPSATDHHTASAGNPSHPRGGVAVRHAPSSLHVHIACPLLSPLLLSDLPRQPADSPWINPPHIPPSVCCCRGVAHPFPSGSTCGTTCVAHRRRASTCLPLLPPPPRLLPLPRRPSPLRSGRHPSPRLAPLPPPGSCLSAASPSLPPQAMACRRPRRLSPLRRRGMVVVVVPARRGGVPRTWLSSPVEKAQQWRRPQSLRTTSCQRGSQLLPERGRHGRRDSGTKGRMHPRASSSLQRGEKSLTTPADEVRVICVGTLLAPSS